MLIAAPEQASVLIPYAQTYTDALIDADGNISKYRKEDYKLDDINSGKLLLRLYDYTHEAKYLSAIHLLRRQLGTQPTTAEGGYWHKRIYPNQMWLDGLYMYAPFLAEYAMRYESGEQRDSTLANVISQFTLVYEHTLCPECHLCHHAWDSARQQTWADALTGRSAHAWGRAEGWYLMALVDVIDIAGDAVDTTPLKRILQSLSVQLLKLQDRRTHCWQQVLDRTGVPGNYFEMSATSMFTYTFLKAHRLGILPKQFRKAALKALEGIRQFHMSVDAEGLVSLNDVCSVAGLSDSRNGSYEYYLSEPVRVNDPKGIGPLLLALGELNKTAKAL